jgi:integrase
MFAFFYKRKKLHLDLGGLAAPHKIERIPQSIDVGALRRAALGIRGDSAASLRTRVILLILCETGCLASELPLISANSVTPTGLKIDGKRPRELAISSELRESIADLRALLKRGPLLSGFNRFGPLPGSLTPRGLEVLLEGLSKAPSFRAVLGALSHLTPRLIRHSVTIAWLRAGIDRAEVQKRLGLTTPYAFRVYEPMFRNDSNP